MHKEKEVIISNQRSSPSRQDEKIGDSFVSGYTGKAMGVRKGKFIERGKSSTYAYKEVPDVKEAKRVMNLYRIMQEAGLPLVRFAKIIREKNGDKFDFWIAMEDLTQDGRFVVEDVDQQLLDKAINSRQLKRSMLCALAVMHNNRIVDFHPGLSFILRYQQTALLSNSREIDFKIIDYPNLCLDTDLAQEYRPGVSFEEETQKDLTILLTMITDNPLETAEFNRFYSQCREQGLTQYTEIS